MRKRMKIGVVGGVFDPIHNGHLILAEHARLQLGLDKVLFVPCGGSYHKNEPTATRLERFTMCQLGVSSNPALSVSGVDITREGHTYTIDTIRDLKKKYGKEGSFCFLIGADNIKDIPKWKNFKTLVRLVKIVAVTRPGAKGKEGALYRIGSQMIEFLDSPSLNISSTKIRKMLSEGNTSAQYMIPEKVWKFIQKRGLYL